MVRPERILIVNPFGIGDVLFTTPLVRAVRQAFPQAYLGFLCNRRTEQILRHNPHLDELFVYERDELVRLWRLSTRWWMGALGGLLGRIRRSRFVLVIDLSLGERYSFLLMALGIPRRVGFNYRRRGRFLTESMPIEGYHGVHVVEYYRQLLHFLGIRTGDASLQLALDEEDRQWAEAWLRAHGGDQGRLLVGMVPAGGVSWGIGAPFRRWSFEGFAAVGDALAERFGARVLLFGESSDRATCQTVAGLMRHAPVDLSGQTDLGQFVSLLARMDLVICNDGGPLHLAVSQRVKTVSIFGPVDPRVYGPYPPNDARHRVLYSAQLLCRPCYHQFRLPPCPYERACLTSITVDDVVQACEAIVMPQGASAGAGHLAR
ncbi:MAG: glycosyltransferase family 9 protein [Candidatus Omnitrophica bacterium]|nr:glycosyltransferase family 9 protein [Candidatus Omnitrophota bacterium]